uniref:Uncharacterized protein n=1 Tax=Nelumbo nucifera TaxID=4432 RepID=A0A822YMC6_NELNU|nr:TPA_asm: hypothetical protein HUJ06_012488 [Nelumbo nucifera]
MAEPIEPNFANSCCKNGLPASPPTPRKSIVRLCSTSFAVGRNFCGTGTDWPCYPPCGIIRRLRLFTVPVNVLKFNPPIIPSPTPVLAVAVHIDSSARLCSPVALQLNEVELVSVLGMRIEACCI